MEFADSDALCCYVAEQNNGVCVLSFSTGKDSLASWLQLRRYFTRVVPVYLYLIPELEFVERSLGYYEEQFDTHILRLPHPGLYRWLHNDVCQAPQNRPILDQAYTDGWLRPFTFDDSLAVTKAVSRLAEETYSAIGIRRTDTPNRWATIKRYGPLNAKRRTFYPVYDWSKDRLIAEIRGSGIKLPVDYQWFGRTFDGIDYRFLKPLHDHAPRDYARVLEWFPVADVDLARIKYREDYYAQDPPALGGR
jgi:hypothetical protein